MINQFSVYKKNIANFKYQLGFDNLVDFNLENLKNNNFDCLVFVGMGGSGLVGDIISEILPEINLNIPVITWKDYDLPNLPYKNPFYFFVSFSGNTEETLSGLKKLQIKNNKNLAIISSDGEMKNLAMDNKIPFVEFNPSSLTPRQASLIMTYASLKIISVLFPQITLPSVGKIDLKKLEIQAKAIALKLQNKLIYIYSDFQNKNLAYFLKTKINETAKSPAFTNYLPELDHNEIVGFENKKFNSAVVFIESNLSKNLSKKFKITQKFLKKFKVNIVTINLKEKDKFNKIIKMLLLADLIAYYLAKFYGVDPIETKIISEMKSLSKHYKN